MFTGARRRDCVLRADTQPFGEWREMICNGFIAPRRRPPRPTDVGIFTLSFRKGVNLDVIKVGARIVWVIGTLASLNLIINQLAQPRRENFSRILDSGQGKID